MDVSLTGNPFVDTGLAVLAYRSGCKRIEELTIEKMKAVHGDGCELARRNSKLKSTSVIFTINSLVTHPGIKPVEKRIQFYSCVTTALLNKIGFEDVHERCESCGHEESLDVDKLIKETLVPLGYKDETRYTGRDWFPLAGSIGSDAQALPAGSRSPNLCAKCLFAVHYLPQGVILRDGRLAVFQSTSQPFWYCHAKGIAEDVEKRILADVFETIGSKQGSAAVVDKTLDTMHNMKSDGLDPGTTLFVWMFSNSGTGPDCRIEEIPNNALGFLFDVICSQGREEIMSLVRKDKKAESSFLNCISKGIDYRWLYPFKKYPGVSPELFLSYQTNIRNVSKNALHAASKIAGHLQASFPELGEFEDFRKDIKNDLAKKNKINRCIAEMVNSGDLKFTEYAALFAQNSEDHLGKNADAWRYISFYTYHTEPWEAEERPGDSQGVPSRLLQYVGAKIFEDWSRDKGITRFKKDILDRLARGRIGISWLRRQFLKEAAIHEGFNYETWKALCLDGNGKESAYEVLFRFRLMWSEWLKTGEPAGVPELPKIVGPHGTDISPDLERSIHKIAEDFLDERDLLSLRKDIIQGLIDGEIGLYWFRTRLSKYDSAYRDEAYWERFFTAEDGHSIKGLRLFQFTLILANHFREQALKGVRT